MSYMGEVRLFQLDSINRKLKFDIAANVWYYTVKCGLRHGKEKTMVLHKCLAGIYIKPRTTWPRLATEGIGSLQNLWLKWWPQLSST
jgi:hypothetical protein